MCVWWRGGDLQNLSLRTGSCAPLVLPSDVSRCWCVINKRPSAKYTAPGHVPGLHFFPSSERVTHGEFCMGERARGKLSLLKVFTVASCPSSRAQVIYYQVVAITPGVLLIPAREYTPK